MQDRPPSDRRRELALFLPLVRTALGLTLRHFLVLAAITATRLVPFYILLTFLPLGDPAIEIIVETAITVPAAAALVRYMWGVVNGVDVSFVDGLSGATAGETLKLLGTDLLILFVTILFAAGGPALFFPLALVWGWVTLLTDQTVVLEGDMFHTAISRSYEMVRNAWTLTAAALLLLAAPELLMLAAYASTEEGAWQDMASRGMTLVLLPFAAVLLTLLYQHLRVQQEQQRRDAEGRGEQEDEP